jgi:hypothetical protein
MARTRLHLRLRPLSHDGASTWMSLSGPLPTPTAQRQLQRLIAALASCTREPIRVVLSAGDLVAWREAWVSRLTLVPERCRDIRFRARRHRTSAGSPTAVQLDLFGGVR